MLTATQLKTIVEDKWCDEKARNALAFGLHVSRPWDGSDQIEFDSLGPARIVYADNVFRIREVLLETENNNSRVVLLTSLRQGDLGNDVVGRLAKSRLFPIDHVASLCGLFKAKELDRTICEPAISQALLEHSPRDGYPPVSAGVLDADTVWRAVSRNVFEMGDREPDRVGLLLWATSGVGPQRFMDAPDELRASLQNRLIDRLGEFAASILRFVDGGAGTDALALAIACQVIFGKEGDAVVSDAAVRLEQFHDRKPVHAEVGRDLGEVAAQAVAELDKNPESHAFVQDNLERADALLKDFRCEEFASRNTVSLESYVQRLSLFATEIKAALAKPGAEALANCEKQQRAIAAHRFGKQAHCAEQVARAEMAVRLIRWLQKPIPATTSFAEQAELYIRDVSFVDMARESVCRGEHDPEIAEVYGNLSDHVAKTLRDFSRRFADGLADWTRSGAPASGLIGVENVLSEQLAPVAKLNPVLMIVMDGLSWAVCHELLEDIRQAHWYEASLGEDSNISSSVIATIPSETKYSRTSLLSGELITGDASTEKRHFVAHARLLDVSSSSRPPMLFHKNEISTGSRGGVSKDLQTAIMAEDQRIVGVVINAVDDRLANAQQIRDEWTVDRINPLGGLLRFARDSGRVVVLASDHGHVWHQADAEFDRGKDGSRWRRRDSECEDGERVISGSRVLAENDGNGIIVPWTETLHYRRKRHGYHGGATPQEMLCPFTLLVHRSSTVSGVSECSYAKPEWWSPSPDEIVDGEIVVKVKRTPKTIVDESGQQRLFVEVVESAESELAEVVWITQLLGSDAYQTKKKLVRRHVPDDSLVRKCLTVLDENGGLMTPAAFSKAASLPAARLDGLVSKLKRMLNVDGYELIDLDRNENKVELHIEKLKRQFDLN